MNFKDTNSNLHVLDDASFSHLLPSGCVEISDAEAEALRKIPITPEQIQSEIVAATQARLDAFARTRGYDGILSACTYATSGVPKFATEGQYCVGARDVTWGTLYTVLSEVQAGTRPMPTGFADVELLLPALVWPA